MASIWAAPTAEPGLAHYLEEIRRFPMLDRQEEYILGKRWREHGDHAAANKLITSHLRLVPKIAREYCSHGLPISEGISAGNVGLMRAVAQFQPEKGFRFAAYAAWWIKASIREHILRSRSLVKMPTTAKLRKVLFNLRKAQRTINVLNEGDMRPDQVKVIARRFGVSETDVIYMNQRLGGDASLNAAISDDGVSGEWQDRLVDDAADQETTLAASEEFDNRCKALSDALTELNERERRIFEKRRLADVPVRFAELAEEFGVTRERVRQIEVRAFEKVRNSLKHHIVMMETPSDSAGRLVPPSCGGRLTSPTNPLVQPKDAKEPIHRRLIEPLDPPPGTLRH